MDQIGMHPNGKKLYVPEFNALNVYDPVTLNPLTSITDPNIVRPTGVCIAPLQNQAPVCSSAWADPGKTWPPNHKMVSAAIAGVTDPDGDALTITVDGVSQDEEVDAKGNGDGKTAPDASLSPLRVRAERQGKGDGRVYTIATSPPTMAKAGPARAPSRCACRTIKVREAPVWTAVRCSTRRRPDADPEIRTWDQAVPDPSTLGPIKPSLHRTEIA